jgi:beta-glucosidase
MTTSDLRRLSIVAIALASFGAPRALAQAPVYKDASAPVEARVEDLLGRMTLDEKIDLLSGINEMDLRPNARLGIPSLKMTDGPLGVRDETGDKVTAFPSGILSASSFDPALMNQAAGAMAVEVLALGRDMLLGPCVNIARAPQGGRNFESFGEDPYLAARMAEAWVTGLQSRKVLASTKHFALNNQETDRMTIDVRASDRAIHEIFLPAFDAAVRAGTWTVMAAYNRLNGHFASENDYLIEETLKKGWGFKGFVVSDWDATHSTVEAANAGLDVEMPSGEFFGGGKLQAALAAGKVPAAAIDDKARRVLRAMIGGGVFDRKDSDRPARSEIASAEHKALALKLAQEGIVLLKNDGVLPLEPGRVKSVALIGPSAAAYRAGGGSSLVPPTEPATALDGFKERAGGSLDVRYARGTEMPGGIVPLDVEWLTPPADKKGAAAHGLYAEYFDNMNLEGAPKTTRIDPTPNFDWGATPPKGMAMENYSVRWTGRLRVPKTGDVVLAVRADDGERLWIDGKKVIDDWSDHSPLISSATLRLDAGRDHELRLEYYQRGGGASVTLGRIAVATEAERKEAVALAAASDAAVVFVGYAEDLESEGLDRASLELPEGQDALIAAVAKANKNVVVVYQGGSPALVGKWADRVRAIVTAWYPGQEGGRAIADVLLGRVNPSGKLPVTWPKRWEDSSAYGRYPGTGKDGRVGYDEDIFVGYRYFDRNGIEPMYPFGHGLSYTTFGYGDLTVAADGDAAAAPRVAVSLDVTNTGARAGAEVVQLYVREKAPKLERPPQELKGFRRVELAPGETKRVSFALDKSAFAYYDPAARAWTTDAGAFEIRVGSSSRDIRRTAELALKP